MFIVNLEEKIARSICRSLKLLWLPLGYRERSKVVMAGAVSYKQKEEQGKKEPHLKGTGNWREGAGTTWGV